MTRIFLLIALGARLILAPLSAQAQAYPSVTPSAVFADSDGNSEEGETFAGSAPITVLLKMNPIDADGWDAHYEWRFYREGEQDAYMIRYEEQTEVTLTDTGNYSMVPYAKFTQGETVVEYDMQDTPFTVEVSESQLYMPNAFSPNGDGINDIYRVKPGYRSIVEFHATIFNRWGQKLYEWSDPAGGWDGTYKGKGVKQGVYFVLVKAKGADGRDYTVKRDVNLLRGYTEGSSTME